MNRKLALTIVLMGLTVTGASAQETVATNSTAAKETDKVAAPQPTEPKHPVSAAGPSYVIGPDDVLHIAVWKEPDLTTTLPVRSDGMISLPLLNDVPAAGLTPMQLAGILTFKLRTYLATPRVTVVVTQVDPQRIYVLGEVLHTGPIPLLPNMTILQALATAGLTQFANSKGIYLLRTDNGQQQKISFNYKQVIKGDGVAQNIALKPGDTIVVP